MISFKSTSYIIGGSTFLTVFFSSCAVQKYEQPELNFPQKFKSEIEFNNNENIAQLNYKDFFKDPVLIQLIDKAMKQNNDLKMALKQIEFAELGYNKSKWNHVPKVEATIASSNITRPSDNSMNGIMANQFMGKKYIEDYSTSLNFSWEADIWGKIKGTKEEALADYLMTHEAAKAIKTRLISEVATGYYNLLMLDTQLKITKENLSYAAHTLDILEKQQELGMITSLAVQQQEIVKEQINKRMPSIEALINIQENSLSLLIGEMPTNIERQKGLDVVSHFENLAIGIPADMLSFRPDVKNNELAFRKSIASIHVAKTSMYPAINITAQGGLNSFKSSNWFNVPGSLFGIVAGSLFQPILNGKQLQTRYKQSQIASEQAEINFKQSVLKAVEEVSNALVEIEKLEEEQKIAEGLVDKANVVINNSVKLYQFGEANYLEVIFAQTNKLQAELDVASIKTQKLNAITALYRSLGGGWQ